MGRDLELCSSHRPHRCVTYNPASSPHNSCSSHLGSPGFRLPDDGTSRFRYQDDGYTVYAAIAAQYQYPTSIYGAHSVATRQDSMPWSRSAQTYSGKPFGEYPDNNPQHSRIPSGTGPNDSPISPLMESTSGRGLSREISTVVIACRACRGRKIRCDSLRPSCNNCVRRKNECVYDSAPKRRGPDKRPGTRQRSCRKKPAPAPAPDESPLPPSKRKRKVSSSTVAFDGDRSTTTALSPSDQSSYPMKDAEKPSPSVRKRSSTLSVYSQPREIQPHTLRSSSSAPLRVTTDIYKHSQSTHSRSSDSDNSGAYQSFIPSPYVKVQEQPQSPYLHSPSGVSADAHSKFPVPSPPVAESDPRNWWTLFLEKYPLTAIGADMQYLFADTGHWLSFINVDFFLDMLWNPEERLKIQPAFILAGLALAELMRSSESERGSAGRERAAWLRDNAQNALTAAISRGNGDWINASLAEAALILVLYESSAHPHYQPERVATALRVLDQILNTISISTLDIMDQGVARFANNSVPIVTVPYRPHQYERECSCMPPGSPPPDATQTWSSPLRWDPMWTANEVRSEEYRRLCWSALSLATSYLVQCAAFDREMPVLELSNPAGYAILFPGEVIDRISPAYCSPDSPSPKEAVWALYCRSLLLWNFCNRLVTRTELQAPHQTEAEADAWVDAWNEAQAIQDSLEMHRCNCETTVSYLTQEYVYNTRMTVTQALRKMQGLSREISTTPGPLFNRKQGRQWIDYENRVIKRVRLATYQLGGPQAYQLTRRPMQVTWYLNQFSVCMQIWTHDTGLTDAVELAKDFLAVVDVLNALWPCKANQTQSDDLRKQLTQACDIVGTAPPLPPSYAESLIHG
ncbi:hypothetical protein C8R46DRAFT_1122067 [Mycena filopes]|nr:hypothetical protein C8R46DRAFT_1122067 [Mycena filopes]